MPALILFHRKWLIACDDLVIPFAIEASLRIIWLLGSLVITWLEIAECIDNTSYIKYFLYSMICLLLLTICLCIGIFMISSRGTVLQVDKRVHLSKVLYVKCCTVTFDIAAASFGVWLLSQQPNLCFQWKIFIEAAVVCLYLYVFAVVIGIFISYNSLGSPYYWNTNNRVNSIQIFKKAERVWRLRLKFFCCCADVSEEENDFIYVEISNFVTTFSNDIDLAPTDILAGLIILSKKHAIERRKNKGIHSLEDVLTNKPVPSWMTAENALHFLRIAKSTYGWFAFFNPLCPWKLCTLLSPSRCFTGCFNQDNSTKHGDCCYCNSSAVEKISGLCDSDMLYASFSNLIYEPAFIITLDHNKKAIIIAIRGTCSFSDLITDIDANEMNFPVNNFPENFKCHRGVLRSALFMQKKINELQILKTAFMEHPSYVLVITGHSLGASIAAILSLLLYPEYPSLQCYSYAPLAVLSAGGIAKTLDFVFSVVVGDDMAPRMSALSCKELIKQIYGSLEETQFPKYKLLTKAFWNYAKKSLKLSPLKVTSTSVCYENKQVEIKDESSVKEVQLNIACNDAQLYAAGHILYLKQSERCDYSWVTGLHFKNIIISPSVVKDHQPHQIEHLLKTFISMENAAQSRRRHEHLNSEII